MVSTVEPAKLIENIWSIRQATAASEDGQRCMVATSPELRDEIKTALSRIGPQVLGVLANRIRSRQETRIGMNDGLIYPGSSFPVGTPARLVQGAAANRAPLAGTVRVVVILVEFSDRAMTETRQHFEDLFFSQGVLPNGSVREYFAEVTNNIIDIQGEVVGPYQLPLTLAQYANGASGTGSSTPNSRTMARDAAVAANPDVNFGIYDNDGDGFVDAFVVLHAGSGAEQTGSPNDIWSHKWVLSGGSYNADGTNIYAYLTVPENARIGVCCHELGHLLFGFPDLYDIDDSSEGVGNWCLMGGGSWNGGGDVPAHPSAWCKANQGWVTVVNQTSNATLNIEDVKTSNTVYRLWKDGSSGSEYFLVENRQQTLYDAQLPGGGLCVWHIDDAVATNEDENHYKVAFVQADGNKDLENGSNRGDAGDPYPGSSNNSTFDKNSTPNSKSYAGSDTCVSIKNIGSSAPTMRVDVTVKCGKSVLKDFKDSRKDKGEKEIRRDKYFVFEKRLNFDKRPEKPQIDKSIALDKRFSEGKVGDKFNEGKFTEGKLGERGNFSSQPPDAQGISNLEARLEALEAQIAHLQPFIGAELRPDLNQGALSGEMDIDLIQGNMQEEAARAKREFDAKPPEY